MEKTYVYKRPWVPSAVRTPKHALGQLFVPQVHQVQAQAELILAAASTGAAGTSGFTGNGIQAAIKRMDVRGVPPRGRPV